MNFIEFFFLLFWIFSAIVYIIRENVNLFRKNRSLLNDGDNYFVDDSPYTWYHCERCKRDFYLRDMEEKECPYCGYEDLFTIFNEN